MVHLFSHVAELQFLHSIPRVLILVIVEYHLPCTASAVFISCKKWSRPLSSNISLHLPLADESILSFPFLVSKHESCKLSSILISFLVQTVSAQFVHSKFLPFIRIFLACAAADTFKITWLLVLLIARCSIPL